MHYWASMSNELQNIQKCMALQHLGSSRNTPRRTDSYVLSSPSHWVQMKSFSRLLPSDDRVSGLSGMSYTFMSSSHTLISTFTRNPYREDTLSWKLNCFPCLQRYPSRAVLRADWCGHTGGTPECALCVLRAIVFQNAKQAQVHFNFLHASFGLLQCLLTRSNEICKVLCLKCKSTQKQGEMERYIKEHT